jgi:hypothetical protein
MKCLKICTVLVLSAVLVTFLSFSVRAEESEQDKVLDRLSDAAEDIDGDIADGLSGDAESVGDFTLRMLSPKEALTRLFGSITSAIPSALTLLALLLGLVTLSAVCNSLCGSVGEEQGGFGFLSSALIVSVIVTSVVRTLFEVEDFFGRLGGLMASMIPVTGAVWAMGGNVSTAGVGTLTLGVMLGFTQEFCAVTVVPVCCGCLVAAISAGLSEGGLLEGFSSGVKRVYSFLVGMVMTVLVFCLGAQTSIAGAADTVTARGAKTLASTLIPGIGGAIGDTLRTVAGSVSYVKGVVGVLGIVLLAVLTLPVLTLLLLSRGAILVSSVVADMLGCKRESRLLSEMGNVYGLLVGAVSMCAIAFSVALALFVRCAVAAG